jgi:hypothetical protein
MVSKRTRASVVAATISAALGLATLLILVGGALGGSSTGSRGPAPTSFQGVGPACSNSTGWANGTAGASNGTVASHPTDLPCLCPPPIGGAPNGTNASGPGPGLCSCPPRNAGDPNATANGTAVSSRPDAPPPCACPPPPGGDGATPPMGNSTGNASARCPPPPSAASCRVPPGGSPPPGVPPAPGRPEPRSSS